MIRLLWWLWCDKNEGLKEGRDKEKKKKDKMVKS
jgi:hypothetical protein